MSNGRLNKQVEVLPSDSDYNEALKLFTVRYCKPHHIYRIQNHALFLHFSAEKIIMEKLYPTESTLERVLYHGTNRDTIPMINDRGFDRSYSGAKNGTVFREGSYFACDMNIAAIYAKVDSTTGHKFVYAARVLVGHSCAGIFGMKCTPNQPNGLPYDSATDTTDATKASIFVIFRDYHHYPLYLYEFSSS